MTARHRRLAGGLAIAVFLLSALSVVAPAQAHFTLGNLTGTYRYHANDFDPHVAGPVGYVWPGGGQNGYLGVLNGASVSLSPGYQSPYPGGNPSGAPSNSWYQLEGDTYAPFGSVLTNSTGDLIFAINATCTPGFWNDPSACATEGGTRPSNGVTKAEIQTPLIDRGFWATWMILIPPEFIVPGAATFDSSQVVTTITNTYDHVYVAKLGPDDRYAPNWTLVAITEDGTADFSGTAVYYNHQNIQFTKAGEWYYARINGVTAPPIAGRYFFKMALSSMLFIRYPSIVGQNIFGVGPTLTGPQPPTDAFNGFIWVPPQNWPVLLVKGEIDPSIVTGTIRYAGYNATLYGQPIAEAGKVWAHMTTRLDPYTGQPRPDLPTIDAQGYVNASAHGHYEVEGLAPGIYDLYASAAGYPQALVQSEFTVLKGQSLHFDIYLQPGPVIHGNVYTKHQFGDEPWPGNATTGQYMKIELYDKPTLTNLVDASAGSPISWSPLPCTAGGQELYYGEGAAGLCGGTRTGSAIAFPWHEYSTDTNVIAQPNINGYSRDVSESSVCSSGNLACTFRTSDPEGVGPPQQWYVSGGSTTPFHFEFGVKGEYGAPKDLSGEVPQVYATWINGLTAGRYYVRAWTFRYVQTALDGSTFQEYYFDITPNEWAGDVTLPLDLRLSSWVNKTVYFHDTPNTLTTSPIHSVAGYLWGNLMGPDGHVYSYNVTGLGYDANYYYSFIVGCGSYDQYSYSAVSTNFAPFFSYSGFKGSMENGAPALHCPSSGLDKAGLNKDAIAAGRAAIQFWGINDTWGGEDYGIPSGTYAVNVAANGYYSPTPQEQVSVTLSGNPTSVSDHLFLGPGFNVSVYSIDWERPRVSRNWVWSGCQTAAPAFACLGSEIDLGFYPVVNGTAGGLADYFGFEPSELPVSIPSPFLGFVDNGGLFQGPGGTDCLTGNSPSLNCAQMDGGGRNVLQGYGNAHDVYYGQSAEFAFVGGYTPGSGYYGFLIAQKLLADSMFTTPYVTWPLHFNEGQYNLAAYTYGYIQDKDFTAYVQNGQVADMKINLIVGVNVTLDILFKKENIITGTPLNMSARVRLFNDQGQLVAEWMSSEGTYVDRSGHAIAANGVLPSTGGTDAVGDGTNPLYPFSDLTDPFAGFFQAPSSLLNGYNFLPGGTTLLHVLMAGLPQQAPMGNSAILGSYFADPLMSGTPQRVPTSPLKSLLGACDFDISCYPAQYGQYPFPYAGIAGAPDYMGGWNAEVDFVPWYNNNTITTLGTCETDGTSCGGQYYPPVNGLLMGESYHIIPGTTATSGISLTEDMALSNNFVGHSAAANHLGPYSQRGTWQISGTHNSGESSAIFEVDLNGFVSGNVLAFTWSNEFRPLSWGAITVTGAGLPSAGLNFYTYDGIYQAFLPVSTSAATVSYTFMLNAPGYAPYSWISAVSVGQSAIGQNVYLEQSNIPVPEFSVIGIVAFSALAASLTLLRRRRS